ncbi:hypothetical protein NE237_003709 [Protea cynaroides]|uniref:Uncharacterized protein n=1 Tax=Protea cynaroides TaxID=273540 RepID=A0A9Q0KHL4_9MAGN|nr:hypothetical protein NE237_003709 [Protea cynaroides]
MFLCVCSCRGVEVPRSAPRSGLFGHAKEYSAVRFIQSCQGAEEHSIIGLTRSCRGALHDQLYIVMPRSCGGAEDVRSTLLKPLSSVLLSLGPLSSVLTVELGLVEVNGPISSSWSRAVELGLVKVNGPISLVWSQAIELGLVERLAPFGIQLILFTFLPLLPCYGCGHSAFGWENLELDHLLMVEPIRNKRIDVLMLSVKVCVVGSHLVGLAVAHLGSEPGA